MNTCPTCGKERGMVVGDFPRSYFCEGHKTEPITQQFQFPMLYSNVGSKYDEKIIQLLEKIVSLLEEQK